MSDRDGYRASNFADWNAWGSGLRDVLLAIRLWSVKGNVPFFILGHMGLWEVQDVLLAILTATRDGSSPALLVVCNMLDRDDGREDHGRVVRTSASGRRQICRRDHARRRSPAHDI